MFKRRPELVGKAPMGHKHYTNHWKLGDVERRLPLGQGQEPVHPAFSRVLDKF